MKRHQLAAVLAAHPAPRHGSIRDAHRAALAAWVKLIETTSTVDVHSDSLAQGDDLGRANFERKEVIT